MGSNFFGKGRKDEKDYRDKRITVQVTISEKELIEELASRNGMTVSEMIRSLCIYKQINELVR